MILTLLACTGPSVPGPDVDTDVGPPVTADTGDTEDTDDTDVLVGTVDTAPTPSFDCANIPATPLSVQQVEGVQGWADLEFDDAGFAYGSYDSAIRRAAYDGTSTAYSAFEASFQLAFLPDGDLAAQDPMGHVRRIHPDGSREVLAYEVHGYGLVLGPDGQLYAGTFDGVQRIDTETGVQTTAVYAPGIAARAIDFSPDYAFVYIGTADGSGDLFRVPLDGALDAAGPPVLVANTGLGSLHDAVAVDWCGNILVSEDLNTRIVRVTPDGVITELLDLPWQSHAHGIAWGSGVGGWRSDAIYITEPHDEGAVQEVVIGVPGRSWTGT